MPFYCFEGHLGSGKTLCAVGRIQDALREGRKVGTNLNLNLEALLPARMRDVWCMRIPDKPRVRDLEALGCGNDVLDESRNGLLVLDELGSWLNSRQWVDKERKDVVDWLMHSRKLGWDVLMIVQDLGMIDKQVREAFVEYKVSCRRLDRVKVPFVGGLISALSGGLLSGRFPQVHKATVRYGVEAKALITERWFYMARNLYAGYDTRQMFTMNYLNGVYSYLSPWHVLGRHRLNWRERLKAWWRRFDRARVARRRRPPAPRLQPLLRLDPDLRVRAARRLLERGLL